MTSIDPAPPALPPGFPSLEPAWGPQLVVSGDPGGRPMIGLVIKRTYRISAGGGWEPVPDDEQEAVIEGEIGYYDAEPPLVAPVAHANDAWFREHTDIVVQGAACPIGKNVRQVTVQFRLGSIRRDIVVHGNRRLERSPSGALRFSDPEPFEHLPVRYDRAYGGVDLAGWLDRPVDPFELEGASDFHYPRNPAGAGFLISLDPWQLEDVPVPNLEFPFDPVTPERLAVGAPDRWPLAPLPAGMDWYAASWFPRSALLGASGVRPEFADRVTELARGWTPPDLLTIPGCWKPEGRPVRIEFAQAASPGMVHPRIPLETIAAGIPLKVVNMHPEHRELRMELPRERPRARLALGVTGQADLETHLSAVVIRPDREQVVMVWSARTERTRAYTPAQLTDMSSTVEWLRDRRHQ